jgi:hypothetical protein
MEQSTSWESDSHSPSQEIPRRFITVFTRACHWPLSWARCIQGHFPPYFPKIHSNIIFTSTPRSYSWSLSFRFSNQNILCISHLSHPWILKWLELLICSWSFILISCCLKLFIMNVTTTNLCLKIVALVFDYNIKIMLKFTNKLFYHYSSYAWTF